MTEQKDNWTELTSGEVIKLSEGEHFTGKFISIEESKMFPESYALTLDVNGENKTLFVNNIVRDKLQKNSVEFGNEIRILYIGKKQNQAGTLSYNNYSVFVKQ